MHITEYLKPDSQISIYRIHVIEIAITAWRNLAIFYITVPLISFHFLFGLLSWVQNLSKIESVDC
jgi:hypothetical protein